MITPCVDLLGIIRVVDHFECSGLGYPHGVSLGDWSSEDTSVCMDVNAEPIVFRAIDRRWCSYE